MAHEKWCGKVCLDCKTACSLDERIPCSPDCKNLEGDKIKLAQCLEDGCEEVGYIFDVQNPENLTENVKAALIAQYGKVGEYPYSV